MSKNDELCIQNEELCIKNEELCIKNDEFLQSYESYCVLREFFKNTKMIPK